MSQAKIISKITKPEKYIGFADLPNQIHRHFSLNGFDFNLMVVGESGLGKSTFINTMFNSDVYTPTKYSEKLPPILSKTMEIRHTTILLTENGVPIRLTLIDTPGFGDCIDNSECWEKIANHINKRYDDYMKWENSPQRTQTRDTRVHCVIYFISPTGHRLKHIDLDFLKKIHEKVNIIPVIGRADCLAPEDLLQFKHRILDDLKINGIKLYDFPDFSFRCDDDINAVRSFAAKSPFAIVSSNSIVDINGKQVRCRKYPWGVCEVENLAHSDFIPLRNLLLRTCTCHLIEVTHTYFYEKHRSAELLSATGTTEDSEEVSPLQLVETEKEKQLLRLDSVKKSLEASYNSKKEELKMKLQEAGKQLDEKLAHQKVELVKIFGAHDDLCSVTSSSKPSPSHKSEEKEKKKDKKKRLF